MESKDPLPEIDVFAEGFENNHRPVRIIKVKEAYRTFKEIVNYYLVQQLLAYCRIHKPASVDELLAKLPKTQAISEWLNAGGQLIKKNAIENLIEKISNGGVNGWSDVHAFYVQQGENYANDKLLHSMAAFEKVYGMDVKGLDASLLKDLLQRAVHTRQWMTGNIAESRAKDYQNPFRLMVYESEKEMEKVLGSFESNTFILQEKENLRVLKDEVNQLTGSLVH